MADEFTTYKVEWRRPGKTTWVRYPYMPIGFTEEQDESQIIHYVSNVSEDWNRGCIVTRWEFRIVKLTTIEEVIAI